MFDDYSGFSDDLEVFGNEREQELFFKYGRRVTEDSDRYDLEFDLDVDDEDEVREFLEDEGLDYDDLDF